MLLLQVKMKTGVLPLGPAAEWICVGTLISMVKGPGSVV